LPARTPIALTAVKTISASAAAMRTPAGPSGTKDRSIDVRREENRDGGERAAVDDEQQRNAVEKADSGMVAALQVDVLSIHMRKARRQLRGGIRLDCLKTQGWLGCDRYTLTRRQRT
jgi:hypothetical protein